MRLSRIVAAGAVLTASLGARADSLIGSTVDVKYEYPNTSTVYTDSGVKTVTPGLQIISPGAANLTFTSANLITVTNPGLGSFQIASFSGFDIMFLSGVTITGAVLDPASDLNFGPGAIVTFTSNDIKINLSGTCQTCVSGNQNLEVDVSAIATQSSVSPEPSSFALLGTGLLGVAGVMRKRFARAH